MLNDHDHEILRLRRMLQALTERVEILEGTTTEKIGDEVRLSHCTADGTILIRGAADADRRVEAYAEIRRQRAPVRRKRK